MTGNMVGIIPLINIMTGGWCMAGMVPWCRWCPVPCLRLSSTNPAEDRPGPLDGVLAPLRTLDVVGVRLGTMDYELGIMEIGSL